MRVPGPGGRDREAGAARDAVARAAVRRAERRAGVPARDAAGGEREEKRRVGAGGGGELGRGGRRAGGCGVGWGSVKRGFGWRSLREERRGWEHCRIKEFRYVRGDTESATLGILKPGRRVQGLLHAVLLNKRVHSHAFPH